MSASSLEAEGCLEASVISVYDLPYADVTPKAVTLSACGMVCSGAPVTRQQGRNTFRFESLKLVAPLRKLYPAMLTVRVVYDNPSEYPHLEANLDLRTLRIDEHKFPILNLWSPGSEGGAIVKAVSGNSITEDDVPSPPTIRIKLKLSGPYRPEVAAIVNFAKMWFGVVDKVEGAITKTSSAVGEKIPSINTNYLLVPVTPVLVVLVAAFPLVAGVAALALPFLLPVVMVLTGVLAATLLGGGIVYSSTKTGRNRIATTLGPLVESLVVSKSGQALVYDTGPRPTPVSVCRQIMPVTIWSKLWISLVIDLIGSCSYLLPVAGEAFDVAWAPAQTIVIMAMYDATSPNLKYVSFLEELLPFTDVIPSACIGWAIEFLPLMWKDHAEKNNISLDPEVTRAVAQLVTKAASVVRTRNAGPPDERQRNAMN